SLTSPSMDTASTLRPREARESVVIRFAGDSGDGMQVTGSRFTVETALAGNDLTTFPDFPAEIRAPAGTTYGVSAFQIQLGARDGSGQTVRPFEPRGAPLPQHVGARPDAVDVRPRPPGDDRVAAPQVRRPARDRPSQRRGRECRPCVRRDRRNVGASRGVHGP